MRVYRYVITKILALRRCKSESAPFSIKPKSEKVKRLDLIPAVMVMVTILAGISFAFPHISSYLKAERFSNELNKELSSFFNGFPGSFSFAFKDLGGPFIKSSKNSLKKFPAASLIKVPILACAFNAVKEEKLSLNDEFILNKEDVTPGSGVLKYSKFPRKITFKKLLEFMIVRSDNTATNKVINILGFDYLNDTFLELDLRQTILNREIMDFNRRDAGVENYISCRDLVYLFDKIYRKELVNTRYSDIMLSFLKKQRINDRIPKYLPKDVVVAHKTGLEKTVVGDAGIIFSKCDNYILCVIASDFSTYKQAKDFIAKISLAIYNKFEDADSWTLN